MNERRAICAWPWVEQSDPKGDLKRAIFGLVYDQTDVLKRMAADFRQTSRIDHSRHGLEVVRRKDIRGNVTEYVRWPTRETMPAGMARQQGYI